MPFVYSTATSSTCYNVKWADTDPKKHAVATHKILIHGGANVATKELWTPRGIVTEVSDSDLEALLQNEHFQEHVKNGFITYEETKKIKLDKKLEGMQPEDESAPLTPNSKEFAGEGKAKVAESSKGKR